MARDAARWTFPLRFAEIVFFGWYLWPDGNRAHPFLNAENALLVLKYSSIYGIAAVGAWAAILTWVLLKLIDAVGPTMFLGRVEALDNESVQTKFFVLGIPLIPLTSYYATAETVNPRASMMALRWGMPPTLRVSRSAW